MSDAQLTQRYVATRRSAAGAAAAFLRLTLRRRIFWGFVGLVGLALTFVMGASIEDGYSLAARSFWALVLALVPTLVFTVLVLLFGYFVNLRSFRRRLREGVVLESGFGERSLVLRGPWSESTLSFDGIASVRVSGDWVFVQQVGVPLLGAWPVELFPPDELARLRASSAAAASRRG